MKIKLAYIIIILFVLSSSSFLSQNIDKNEYITIDEFMLKENNGVLDFNLFLVVNNDKDTLFIPRIEYNKFVNPIYYYNLNSDSCRCSLKNKTEDTKALCKLLIVFKDFRMTYYLDSLTFLNTICDIEYCFKLNKRKKELYLGISWIYCQSKHALSIRYEVLEKIGKKEIKSIFSNNNDGRRYRVCNMINNIKLLEQK